MKRIALLVVSVVALVLAGAVVALAGNYNEECESYRNHSGNIPGYYDYAVFFEQGYEPVELETNGVAIYLAPPDGGTWDRVYKCHWMTTTTTTVETTTTTFDDTTTTSVGETTTTAGESTTTTVNVEDTTTTVVDSTTTTDPSDPPVLPFTGPSLSWPTWALIGSLFIAAGVGLIKRMHTE